MRWGKRLQPPLPLALWPLKIPRLKIVLLKAIFLLNNAYKGMVWAVTCCRQQVKTNRPIQTGTFSTQLASCLIYQEHFTSYWSRETVGFIFKYRDEPLLSNTTKSNMLRYTSIFWAYFEPVTRNQLKHNWAWGRKDTCL